MASLPPFRPLPGLDNPHLQTVLANLPSWARIRIAPRRLLVDLADGDRLLLHDSRPQDWRDDGAIVLLLHGLGGCHDSGYMCRVANRFLEAGVRVCRMDLRGAGAGLPYASRLYNAACSDDVRAALGVLHQENPVSRLFVAGFSLGGNIALKLAGEAASQPIPGLHAVAAVAPPIDLVRCAELISRLPFYDRYYVRRLIDQVAELARLFPHLPRVAFPRTTTLREFDDLYTAPRSGYADALDYYRKASAFPLLPAINLPTFVLTASDDPFVAVEPFEEIPALAHLDVHIAPRGGHLGFLGPDGSGGIRWAERQVVDWMLRQIHGCGPGSSRG